MTKTKKLSRTRMCLLNWNFGDVGEVLTSPLGWASGSLAIAIGTDSGIATDRKESDVLVRVQECNRGAREKTIKMDMGKWERR